jgi:hypothetical protein
MDTRPSVDLMAEARATVAHVRQVQDELHGQLLSARQQAGVDSWESLKAEGTMLMARTTALRLEHEDIESRTVDLIEHAAHRAKLHAHIEDLRAHLEKVRLYRQA